MALFPGQMSDNSSTSSVNSEADLKTRKKPKPKPPPGKVLIAWRSRCLPPAKIVHYRMPKYVSPGRIL